MSAMTAKVRIDGQEHEVLIEPDAVDGGFIAECAALPGCLTDGETEDEALFNIRHAIADWLAAGQEKRS
jgi:predicted RNase H-like HicB family nuclease